MTSMSGVRVPPAGTTKLHRDHDTLEPMAKTWVDVGQLCAPIPRSRSASPTKDGALHGPFRLRFDPLAEIRTTRASLAEARRALRSTCSTVSGKPNAYFSNLLWHRPAVPRDPLARRRDTRRPQT